MRTAPLFALLLTTAACTPTPADEVVAQPVVAGQLDTANSAVVFITGADCSGAIVGVDGTNGYVLTAAHCLEGSFADEVIVGNQISTGQAFPVAEAAVHPLWDPTSYDYDFYDIAMIRFTGASADLPTAELLHPEEDNLAVGTELEHTGFGAYESTTPCVGDEEAWTHTGEDGVDYYMCWPDHRRGGTAVITEVYPQSIVVAQNYQQNGPIVSGVCSGDSGSPRFVQIDGKKKVAAVVSATDEQCTEVSFSSRVSTKLDDFIVPFMTTAEGGAGGLGGGANPGGNDAGGAGGAAGGDAGGGNPDGGSAESSDADDGCQIGRSLPGSGGLHRGGGTAVALAFVLMGLLRRRPRCTRRSNAR